ncbi:DUF2815 family protein [Caproicibacterium sp. XB1]|uniref:DUF2815 family protein n=1 Tax=Caproicibacterium sp. XB1 TaxID=3396405 RepID=UPI0039B70032
MPNNNPAHIVLKNVRLSYVHLDKPYAGPTGTQDPKYTVTILVPKKIPGNKQAIDAAIAAAAQKAQERYGKAFPARPKVSVHDGDGTRPSDNQPFGDECKGMWVFTASSKQQPDIRDEYGQKLLDMSQVYSGVWAHVGVTFFGYNAPQNKGIGVGIETVMKARDDEPLGGGRANADDDFADIMQQNTAPATIPQTTYAQPAPAGQTIVGYDPNTFAPIYG